MALLATGLSAQIDTVTISNHAKAVSAYMQAGNYSAAERENLIIVRLQPQMAEAYVNLGLSRFLQKHYSDALVAFDKGLKLNPELANARLFSGMSEFKLNRPSAAIPLLTQYVAARPADFEGQYYLGLSYLTLERFSEARSALNAAARIDNRSVDVFYHLAQTSLEEARKDPGKAEELAGLYQSAVERISEIDPDSFRLAQLRAAVDESEGKKADAIAELEAIFERDPNARGLHYTLGCLYLEQRDYKRALEQFEAEQKLDSPYFRTDLQIGHVYLALEKPALAIPFLEKALTIDPQNDGIIWVDFGRAYRLLNQPARAVAAYEKAIVKGQGTSAVYYQLAIEAKKAGNLSRSSYALAMSRKLRSEDDKSSALPVSR